MEIDARKFGRVGILMGGPSSEREISLKSGRTVFETLRQIGIAAEAVEINTQDRQENIRLIKSKNLNVAFIALHGSFGEDGSIQIILDSLKIPYTCSGVFASKLAMDKIASRQIFSANGLNVPRSIAIEKHSCSKSDKSKILQQLGMPLVIKPAACGSSIGISIIDKMEDFEDAVAIAFRFDDNVILEEYIKGRELTVGILNEQALPVIEVVPKKTFFDYEAKYKSGLTEYLVPAEIPPEIAQSAQEAALKAHRLLGCLGCSRSDIILSRENLPFILELNSIPGLTAASLLPKAAQCAGIDFAGLCLRLIESAYEKK